VLLLGAFAMGALVWPAASLAQGPTGPGGGPLNVQAHPNLAMPTLVPGATVGVVTYDEAAGWTGAPYFAGAGSNTYYATDGGSGATVMATLKIPAGSTLARVDVYGFRSSPGRLNWYVGDIDGVNSSYSTLASGSSEIGTGIIQTTFSTFASSTIASGHRVEVDLNNAYWSGGVGFSGVVYQYFPPTMSLVPMTPVRVFDSRFSRFGGAINAGTTRLVNVKNSIDVTTGSDATANAIPQGARAISFTVTVTGTVGAGNVAVLPGTTTTVTASTINWSASGQTLAAGGIVTLGSGAAERQVTFVVGGPPGSSTHVILDITGYYL
jgi:hypothetical protein